MFLATGAAWIVPAFSESHTQALIVSAEPSCVHQPAPRPIDYLLPFLVLKIERDVALLNGQPLKQSEIANALMKLVQTRASTTMHLLVDPEVDYGRVISVLKLFPKRSTIHTIILTPGAIHDLGDNFCWFRNTTP